MTWNAASPNGNQSVKANRAQMNTNNSYIQSKMGDSVVGTNTATTRDHFWSVDANLDGRHRFIQSPAFTVGGNPANPVLGTSMAGVSYFKTTNGRVEGFYRNASGIYQHIPSFLEGSIVLTGSNTDIVAVPNNVYGEIFMWLDGADGDNSFTGQPAFFKATNSIVRTWGYTIFNTADNKNISFVNGAGATTLNIRGAVTGSAASGKTWRYRVTYRAM